jgi:hypothetical protein
VTIPRSRVSVFPLLTKFPFRTSCLLNLCVLALVFSLSVRAAAWADSDKEKKAEKPYALLFGTVWGPNNQPLYGVKVKIRRADQKKAKWEQISDHSGEFAQRLPAGTADYLVWADLKGYKPLNGKELGQGGEVKVHFENDERADIGLHLK